MKNYTYYYAGEKLLTTNNGEAFPKEYRELIRKYNENEREENLTREVEIDGKAIRVEKYKFGVWIY